MARRKLARIKQYDKAKTRLAAIVSIDPALDLGNGMSVSNFQKKLDTFNSNLRQYNTTLSTVDDLYNQCITGLQELQDFSERILSGIASQYGRNSSQYEMAGGKRKSERKKKAPKNTNA